MEDKEFHKTPVGMIPKNASPNIANQQLTQDEDDRPHWLFEHILNPSSCARPQSDRGMINPYAERMRAKQATTERTANEL